MALTFDYVKLVEEAERRLLIRLGPLYSGRERMEVKMVAEQMAEFAIELTRRTVDKGAV